VAESLRVWRARRRGRGQDERIRGEARGNR
jgi:hypothetical protein